MFKEESSDGGFVYLPFSISSNVLIYCICVSTYCTNYYICYFNMGTSVNETHFIVEINK